MNVKQALLVGSILAVPAMAVAQPINGLYVGAGAGGNILNPEPNKGFGLPNGSRIATHDGVHFDTGWTGVASVGYGFGNGLRAEIEGDFYRNQVGYVAGIAPANGFENKYGGMVNVLYDIDLSSYGVSVVQPYVGVGAGYQWARWGGVYAGAPPAQLQFGNTAPGGFAYQGILGLAMPLRSMPGLALTAEYRFMDMPFNRNYNGTLVTPGLAVPGMLKMGEEINQSVLLGLRYAFNVAPPPAPPPPPAPAPVAAPAPAPSRTYLVFFDWDKADLTDRARQIVAEAAQNSTRVQVTRIEVNGYTDASGTPQYNQKLSLRRAQNVEAELVKDGVPQNTITVQGFGETHPLVPTADGVREPQNRRVEIILR
ncbi:MAG: OmpA family protein [Rhodospirillales bacterium]|nr:OmpA family protein [Rhodospirillales bacterium]